MLDLPRALPHLVLLLWLALAPSARATAHSVPLSRALDAACADAAACSSLDLERQPLGDDLAWYRFRVRVGSGEHDVVRVHRIVRERAPWWPRPTRRSILLAHGDRWAFEATFLPSQLTDAVPDDHNLAVFLAENDIDVWGIDFRWSLVPAETPDVSFMADWGLARDAADLDIVLGVARLVRGLGGSGFGPVHLAGFSRGGQTGYVHLAAEASRPALLRHVDGFVVLDIGLVSDDPDVVAGGCERYDATLAAIEAGSPVLSVTIFELIGDLALAAPDEPSPIFPVLTNRQLAIDVGAFTEPDGIVPFFHAVAGVYDASGFVPQNLIYTTEEHYFAHLRAQGVHQPRRIVLDAEAILCDQVESPLDDGLTDITVPLLYVGAGGGFGAFGLDTTARLASTDVTVRLVDFEPPENRAHDFGHLDLLLADDAEALVWQPILDWLRAR